MLHKTNDNEEVVWKVVKEARRKFLSDNNFSDQFCRDWGISNGNEMAILPENHIEINIKEVEKNLKVEKTEEILNDIKDNTLQTAFDLFVYLNLCPNHEFQHEFLQAQSSC